MKNISYILGIMLCFLFQKGLQAQEQDSLVLLKSLDVTAELLEVDRLQQVYLVDAQQGFYKYSADGKLLGRFNENALGKITHIDVSNPFQPMLYYGSYQTAIVLDRTLSEMHRFRLGDMGFFQVEAIGLSSDNKLWLYDPNNFMLKKVSNRGEVLNESPDLSVVLNDAFSPKRLLERENTIFVNDPDFGIMLFDNFGNYKRSLKLLGLDYFQVVDGRIIWLSGGVLHRYQLKSLKEDELSLEQYGIEIAGLLQFCWSAERICLRYSNRILFFKWFRA